LRADMPMQFADPALDQPHFNAGHFLRDGKVSRGHLPRPSAFLDALVRIAERIFEGRLTARVGGRRESGVRLGGVKSLVASAGLCFVDGLMCVAAHVAGLLRGGKDRKAGRHSERGRASLEETASTVIRVVPNIPTR